MEFQPTLLSHISAVTHSLFIFLCDSAKPILSRHLAVCEFFSFTPRQWNESNDRQLYIYHGVVIPNYFLLQTTIHILPRHTIYTNNNTQALIPQISTGSNFKETHNIFNNQD